MSLTPHIANYEAESTAFASLLDNACRSRILLFRGVSGSGKTTLLGRCRSSVAERNFPCITFDFKNSAALNIAEVFHRPLNSLQQQVRFDNFTAQVREWTRGAQVEISGNALSGFKNKIEVALQVQQQSDREHRLAALTEAWCADLRTSRQPVVFIFDHYEKATSEMQQWVSGPFLYRISEHTAPVRVLLAGQEVPESDNIEWGHCCQRRDLLGVPEAKAWLPVVKALGKRLPSVDWLAGVCYALKGRPKDIMAVIRDLPNQEATI